MRNVGSMRLDFVLLGKSKEEIEPLMRHCNEPHYHSKQIVDYLVRGTKKIDDMNYVRKRERMINDGRIVGMQIPKSLRTKLKEMDLRTGRSHLHSMLPCKDGTVKFLLQLADGRVVEAVAIPINKGIIPRLTACISAQAGRGESLHNPKPVFLLRSAAPCGARSVRRDKEDSVVTWMHMKLLTRS